MPLGLYISVPFCRSKCSYCNFASDVFSRAAFQRYIDRVVQDIAGAAETASAMGGEFESTVDSIYLGGGTPTLLASPDIERLFVTISQNFEIRPNAEITVECAPGTLSSSMLETLLRCGANRVSLGVQSFVDEEARAVGRLHTRAIVLEDIARLRARGIQAINVDLIAGLPHQTAESWEFSLAETIASGAPHVSVYMLEVDEDSRLGRELIAGGTRYHAHFVPDEEAVADFYLAACERLDAAEMRQYEISNFARHGFESQHNLKYWTRQPYFGFGVDAHSMLRAVAQGTGDVGRPSGTWSDVPAFPALKRWAKLARPSGAEALIAASGEAEKELKCSNPASDLRFQSSGEPLHAVRFATPDSLEAYLGGAALTRTPVTRQSAVEETFFLGLRLVRGVDLEEAAAAFGHEAVAGFAGAIAELETIGLLVHEGKHIGLTPSGRLLSNEVFERFLGVETRQETRQAASLR